MSKVKKFRIKEISNNPNALRYRVDQRHTILFFIHYWDYGSYDLCPKYLFSTKEEALKAIANLVTIIDC